MGLFLRKIHFYTHFSAFFRVKISFSAKSTGISHRNAYCYTSLDSSRQCASFERGLGSVRFFCDFLGFFKESPKPVFPANDPFLLFQWGFIWYQSIRLLNAHLLRGDPSLYDFFTIFWIFSKDPKTGFYGK